MKQSQTSIKNLARLLQIAAKKHNESAEASCSVADCIDRADVDLSEEMLDCVFEAVTELASVSPEKKPDYPQAARELIARIARTKRG